MTTMNSNTSGKGLTSYVRWYLEMHPEMTWRDLLQSALQHEIGWRINRERRPNRKPVRRAAMDTAAIISPSAPELKNQAWIDDRLVAYYERRSWTDSFRRIAGAVVSLFGRRQPSYGRR